MLNWLIMNQISGMAKKGLWYILMVSAVHRSKACFGGTVQNCGSWNTLSTHASQITKNEVLIVQARDPRIHMLYCSVSISLWDTADMRRSPKCTRAPGASVGELRARCSRTARASGKDLQVNLEPSFSLLPTRHLSPPKCGYYFLDARGHCMP